MSNEVNYNIVEMTYAQATDLYATDWWVGKDKALGAHKELFTNQPIMPFELYLEGLKQILGRDVHRAEASQEMKEVLRAEYLGLKTKPSGEELEPLVKIYNKTIVVPDERD